jgi:hypothetical protein
MVDRVRWLHPRHRGAQRRAQVAGCRRGFSEQGCSGEDMVSLGLEGKVAAQTDLQDCSSVIQTSRRDRQFGRESIAATPAVNNAATEASRARGVMNVRIVRVWTGRWDVQTMVNSTFRPTIVVYK